MGKTLIHYHLCPECFRTTPVNANEQFCPNDGTKMLEACPKCQQNISNPYARYCVHCGQAFIKVGESHDVSA